ncbi:MAG: IS200/IS605 family transposase [Acutalibacteraceae bacterium]
MKKANNAEYYTNRHSCFLLQYHLVVVTKYRHPVLVGTLKNRLLEITENLFTEKWKCNIIAANTGKDHIHILFEATPQTQLSTLVNNYKTVTSRLLRKEFAEMLAPYYWKPYFWSNSYFICSVSDRNEALLQSYINSQES